MSPSPDPVEREREEAIRDDLTVLVQRIHPHADDFEIFEFFSQAGRVRDIRLIRDQRSGKSKGVGYVEFYDLESVMKALALNGIAADLGRSSSRRAWPRRIGWLRWRRTRRQSR